MASRPSRSARAQPKRQTAPGTRRAEPDAEGGDGLKPQRRPRLLAHELVAEVERLERALADAKTRMAELEACADIDLLTGIRNRRGFGRELERSLAYAKRYGVKAALVYLDLDGLKPINDRFGHAAGDAVLRAVAQVLKQDTRASDVVARLGGDEFAVLLWNVAEADARAKALRLEEAVADTAVPVGPDEISVGASAGLAMLGALDSADFVLDAADKAMYARKAEKAAGAARRAS